MGVCDAVPQARAAYRAAFDHKARRRSRVLDGEIARARGDTARDIANGWSALQIAIFIPENVIYAKRLDIFCRIWPLLWFDHKISLEASCKTILRYLFYG